MTMASYANLHPLGIRPRSPETECSPELRMAKQIGRYLADDEMSSVCRLAPREARCTSINSTFPCLHIYRGTTICPGT